MYLLNVVIRIIFFLNSANLICRGTDISKYFRESLGIRDNESRLYLVTVFTVNIRTPERLTYLYKHLNKSYFTTFIMSATIEPVATV